MTREMKIKRVLFFVTMFVVILFPFTLDGGVFDAIVFHITTVIMLTSITVAGFWGCTKKDFRDITGMNIFEEE